MAKMPKIEVNDQVSFFSGKEEVTGTIKEIITRRWIDEKGNEQKARAYSLEDENGETSWWESEKSDESLFVLSNEFEKYEIIEDEEDEEESEDEDESDDDFDDDDDQDEDELEDDDNEEEDEPEEKPKKKVKSKKG